MNPLEQMVEDIVVASSFKKEKDKQELRKELMSHFLDESRDLALQGHDQEKVVVTMQNNFGNIATVSRELSMINTMTNKNIFTVLKKSLIVVASLGMLLILGVVVVGISEPYFNTLYATNFTDKKFDTIKVGMSKNEVRSILGNPLASSFYDDTQHEVWRYTGDKTSRDKGGGNFFLRVIHFKDDVVVEVTKYTWYD